MAWCNSKHKVEDYQHILRHYVNLWGWDCDPGEIDNILGPKTKEAIRKFQEKYNEEFQKNIKVDGIVGEETWGAFYDCYINEVADIMGTDVNEIREKYQKNVLDKRATIPSTHPCGESYPIEEPNRDNYRSQTNRRVEVLFFNENEAPKKCYNIPEKVSSDPTASPFKDKPCNIEEECPIYKKGLYKLKKVKK
ncbi:MAG: hypothetical protein CVT89_00065 [Candidatus Altiarchaeales archaeon HGW-Altiarchaeales-2]|nr:MAG: hypothetical protein CVT89_00065 [Candidatus Altiarchaeales archaeon HGW-Altiarchaeales-2]